ncbi:MAG: folate family ECF transporter S component [Clostridiales Family XIII bacterium]|nr:folate family ECF transporter S component [Clostridiales Family XIII bacterium]
MNNRIFKILSLTELCVLGLLIALIIILSNLLAIKTPIFQITFAFVPIIVLCGLYGMVWGGISLAISDILANFLFPTGGAFFPGWTITACLTGIVYGFFLCRDEIKLKYVIISVLIVSIIFDLLSSTLFLYIMYGKGSLVTFPYRCLLAPIRILLQILVAYKLLPIIKRIKR